MRLAIEIFDLLRLAVFEDLKVRLFQRIDEMSLLVAHRAVINTRTKLVFFKTAASVPLQLSAAVSSEKFTTVPLRREENGGFTVSCSINGQQRRVFVDTGAFVTTLNERLLRSLGIALQPAHVPYRYFVACGKWNKDRFATTYQEFLHLSQVCL